MAWAAKVLQESKRNPLRIMADILILLSDASLGKTAIGHKTNLDTRARSRYVKAMLDMRLIEEVVAADKKHVLRITSSGRDFLEYYEKIEAIFRNDLRTNLIEKN